MQQRKHILLIILLVTLVTGCTNITSYHTRTDALSNLGTIIVMHTDGDNQHLETQIISNFQQRGFNAVADGETITPPDPDTLVYYVPYWMEEAHGHMLHLHVHDAHTHQLLASATSSQSFLQSRNLKKIVQRMLDELFSHDN
tara:strand:- start:1808 stop:2233 length:426 start_codon:yes stop_codon:yes gene_type:complete